MAIPPSAVAFQSALDPHEELDFIIGCSSILETGEEIVSYTLTPLAEAVALGLTIMSGSGRDHALVETNTAIKLWLEIDDLEEDEAAFNGVGVTLPIEVTIETNSSPVRTRQRTILVKVVNQ